MNTVCYKILLIFSFFFAVRDGHSEKLNEEQINRLKRSIVKILVNGKIGSGFIYMQGKYAVTAFHVISGSNGKVKVQYPALGLMKYDGTVIKTLKEADLALIEIQDFPNVVPLKISGYQPVFDAQFTTIGFLWDAPETWSRSITKRENKVLSSMIPTETRKDIESAGCPSPQLPIYSFEGNPLVPGYSGAPIFHSDEGIIGISDGGIKDGVASVSWAIPVSNLNRLMNSSEYVQGNSIKSQSHFSADVITNPGWEKETITIGSNEFSKVRSERLANIINYTDDVTGLNQLLSVFPPQIDRNILFDVYQDFKSGASFIIPSGFKTSYNEEGITVFSADRRAILTVKFENIPSGDVNRAYVKSNEMEIDALKNDIGWTWLPEPTFTYITPYNRADGFIARRKAFQQLRMQYDVYGQQQVYYNKYLFESFIYKRGLLIHLYTVNNNYNTAYLSQFFTCMQTGFISSYCQSMLPGLKDCMALIIATQFATFAVN